MPKTASAASAFSKTAEFITAAVDASPKSQIEIASEIGFPRPNIISMIKMGITKLPLTRIPAVARVLDIDPGKLFRIAMEEYMPDLLKVCDEVYGRAKLRSGEEEVLQYIRLSTKGRNFTMNSDAKAALGDFCKALTVK